MGLINAYVTELTNLKNESQFKERIELLKKGETESYNKMIFDLCMYQAKI